MDHRKEHDLNHLFDQLSPSQAQEDAIFTRLLEAGPRKRTCPAVSLPKVFLAAAVAAVMLMTCAFAAVSLLDTRLLSFFQRTPRDTDWITQGVVAVEQSHTYPSGWTVEVQQVLMDRYMISVLVDVTAPDGTVLPSGEQLYLDLMMEESQTEDPQPDRPSTLDGGAVGAARVSGSRQIADTQDTDSHYSFLCYQSPSVTPSGIQDRSLELCIIPSAIWQTGEDGDILINLAEEERWSCAVSLPAEDSGLDFQTGQVVQVGKDSIQLTSLYLSPISCVFQVSGPVNRPELLSLQGLSSMEEKVFLTLKDGSAVPMYRSYYSSYNPDTGKGVFVLQNERIISPGQVDSITILDQTFSLSSQ